MTICREPEEKGSELAREIAAHWGLPAGSGLWLALPQLLHGHQRQLPAASGECQDIWEQLQHGPHVRPGWSLCTEPLEQVQATTT